MRVLSMKRRTDDFDLESLVLAHGITETSAFMFFPTKVFDRLIVEQTVGMDSARDLHLVSSSLKNKC